MSKFGKKTGTMKTMRKAVWIIPILAFSSSVAHGKVPVAKKSEIAICASQPSTPELIGCFAELKDNLTAKLNVEVAKAKKSKPSKSMRPNGDGFTFVQSIDEAQAIWSKDVEITCHTFANFYIPPVEYGSHPEVCEMRMYEERIKLFKWLNSGKDY